MLVNFHIDPEIDQFIVETNLPTPKNGRVVMLIYQRVSGLTKTIRGI